VDADPGKNLDADGDPDADPFDVLSHSAFFPFDVLSHSVFCLSMFCRLTFFTFGVCYFDFLSVNLWIGLGLNMNRF
jgi:hypothetical protein